MLIDTHCHVNIMVKKNFDQPLTEQELLAARTIINEATKHQVATIINVGTSLIESNNCIELAHHYSECFAAIGIHPNDCTSTWQKEVKIFNSWLKDKNKSKKIVAIGEIGIDKHYPEYNLQRQQDAFKAQIELALEFELPIIVHTRQAPKETLQCLDEYRRNNLNGVIHCFSEDNSFANEVINNFNFFLGIGGTLTYPKNEYLRSIFSLISLDHIVLETDAPYLPPQVIRGKKNHPQSIQLIAQYLAELRNESFETIAQTTTHNAKTLFKKIL